MVDYQPFSEAVYADPFPIYRQLRDEAPAYYLEEFDCWFLSRFEDIWTQLQDQRHLTSARGTTTTHLLTHQTPVAPSVSMFDPPEHTKARSFVSPHFRPRAALALEELAREFTRRAFDDVAEKGECDAVADLGGAVAVRIACSILGVPLEDADAVMQWVNTYFDRAPGQRGTTKRGVAAVKDLHGYLFDLVRKRRVSPVDGETVLNRFLAEDLDGRRLSDMEVASHLNMLVIGGTETLPKVFSKAVYRLFQHPNQRDRCIADPSLLPDAFQETLRYDMPTQMLGRSVLRDFELHGETVREGQGLMFLWASANRDEREFSDPDRFDIERRAPRILSFGHGTHTCLGAHVARMEGRVLLEELLARIPDYTVDEERIEHLSSEFFRGFLSLPISFERR